MSHKDTYKLSKSVMRVEINYDTCLVRRAPYQDIFLSSTTIVVARITRKKQTTIEWVGQK